MSRTFTVLKIFPFINQNVYKLFKTANTQVRYYTISEKRRKKCKLLDNFNNYSTATTILSQMKIHNIYDTNVHNLISNER